MGIQSEVMSHSDKIKKERLHLLFQHLITLRSPSTSLLKLQSPDGETCKKKTSSKRKVDIFIQQDKTKTSSDPRNCI